MIQELSNNQLEIIIDRIIHHGKLGLRGVEPFEATQLKYYIQDIISECINGVLKIQSLEDNMNGFDETEIVKMKNGVIDFYIDVFDMYPESFYDEERASFNFEVIKLYHAIFLMKDTFIMVTVLNIVKDFLKEFEGESPFDIGNNEVHFKNEIDSIISPNDNPEIKEVKIYDAMLFVAVCKKLDLFNHHDNKTIEERAILLKELKANDPRFKKVKFKDGKKSTYERYIKQFMNQNDNYLKEKAEIIKELCTLIKSN